MLLKNKRKPTKIEVYHFLRNTLIVILGTCILAFGAGVFIVPFNLVTGGLSGLGIIISGLFGGKITIDLVVTILTWFFFLLGFIFLKRAFVLQTLTSTIVYPIAFSLFMKFPEWFPFLKLDTANPINPLLAALFGGMLVGTGCAVTYLGGGSTGGLDILAFVICKYQKKISSSKVLFLQDALIVIGGLFFFKDLSIALMGILSAFVMALVIDKVFVGKSKEFVAFIISSKYEKIFEEIKNTLDRTATYIDVVGAYSQENKNMIMVSFTMNQYSKIVDIVSSCDKKAFMTISRAHEIKGEGFRPMDVKEENDE